MQITTNMIIRFSQQIKRGYATDTIHILFVANGGGHRTSGKEALLIYQNPDNWDICYYMQCIG